MNLQHQSFSIVHHLLALVCVGCMVQLAPGQLPQELEPQSQTEDKSETDGSEEDALGGGVVENGESENDGDAGTPNLIYRSQPQPLLYRVKLTVDFGEKELNLEQNRLLVYHVKESKEENLEVRYECLTLPSQSKSSRYYGERPSLFKLGPMSLQSVRGSAPAEITETGDVVKVIYGIWLCGLPFDVGRLPFLPLANEPKWTVDQPVTMGYPINSGRSLQIMPVSPKIGPQRPDYYRGRSDNKSPQLVTVLEADYSSKSLGNGDVMISESYQIDGGKFDPQIQVTGKGVAIFSPDRGVMRNLNRTFVVTLKSTNQSITVPISISLTEASPSDKTEYLKIKSDSAERLAKAREERESLERSLPEMEDRQAILDLLKKGDQKKIEMLATRLRNEEFEVDSEMGLALYESVFRMRSVPYSLRELIKKIAPDFEKTTSILEKFSSSFDIALTGKAIPNDQQLIRGQIICHPEYSRWKAATFYGSVDDVLVLTTRERTPKLIAVRRKNCRLPVESFIDPAVTASKD